MSKKIWKSLLIVFLVLSTVFLISGIGLLVVSSLKEPSSTWFNDKNEPLIIQFDNSALYIVGGLLLIFGFILSGFLIINFTIRKRLIKDIKEEKADGKVKVDLKKYDFLLAHILPYSKKDKEILKGVIK